MDLKQKDKRCISAVKCKNEVIYQWDIVSSPGFFALVMTKSKCSSQSSLNLRIIVDQLINLRLTSLLIFLSNNVEEGRGDLYKAPTKEERKKRKAKRGR